MLKAVLIGDSIRRNYQMLVAAKLEGRVGVVGPWENCRHSLWALDHYQRWVGDEMAEVIHVNFGLHDCGNMPDGRPQIVLEQYKLCVRRFFARAKDPMTSVIWATTTPAYKAVAGTPMREWVKRPEVEEYNAAALQIAREEGVRVNDLHQAVLDRDFTKCVGPDGLHMSPYGCDVLAEAVAQSILAAVHARPGHKAD